MQIEEYEALNQYYREDIPTINTNLLQWKCTEIHLEASRQTLWWQQLHCNFSFHYCCFTNPTSEMKYHTGSEETMKQMQ